MSALGPGERRAKLIRTADVLETRVEDFIATMAAETGATAGRAKHNVRLAANMLREAAAMTTHITGEVIPSDERTLALAVRQPAGVVLGIAPWNGPVILGVRAIAMALACGNTVILKASEICPATHRLIGEVMLEAGLAPCVVNIVTNAPTDVAKSWVWTRAQPKSVIFPGLTTLIPPTFPPTARLFFSTKRESAAGCNTETPRI